MSDSDSKLGKPPPTTDPVDPPAAGQDPKVAKQEAALEEAFFADEAGEAGSAGTSPTQDGEGGAGGAGWKGSTELRGDLDGQPDGAPSGDLGDRVGMDDMGDLDDMEVEGEDELRRILGSNRSRRHPLLAVAVVLASLFGLWWLWADVAYFFRPNQPQSLGDASKALQAGRLHDNTYVTLTGAPLPQSMASNKPTRSWFAHSVKTRERFFILSGTQHKVVVKLTQTKGERVSVFPKLFGMFTGRLRRLDDTPAANAIRSYYRRQSRVSSGLRPFHEITGQEILSHAGKGHATFVDLRGRHFEVKRDTVLEVFVAYPQDYELVVHTDLMDPMNGVAVQGGDGAPTCGPPVPFVPPTARPAGAPGKPPGKKGRQPPPMLPGAQVAARATARPSEARPSPARPAPGRSAPARPAPGRPASLQPAGAKTAAAASHPLRKGRLRSDGWGGSVYLRSDPTVFTLDALVGGVRAPSGAPGGGAHGGVTHGADRIVPIPPGTLVYAGAKRDCRRACRWRGSACKKACSGKAGLQILPVNGLAFVAAGGDCAGKGERTQVNLQLRPIKTAARAEALVRSLGFPYFLTEDDTKSTQSVHFVVRMPKERAQRMERRSGRGSPLTLSARYEVIRVRWGELARQSKHLVFRRTRRSYPVSFERVSTPKGPRLRPQPLGPHLRVASTRVLKAAISRPLELPHDAFLLEVGVKPRDMWFEPFVPGAAVFAGLLILFALLNLWALVAYFRS